MLIDKAKNIARRASRYVRRTYALQAFGAEKRRILFVLGHMRTGSSLLVHLLNSNPEIRGYGETHLYYFSPRTFTKLDQHVQREFEANGQKAPPVRYVMDKVLHERFTRPSSLQHPGVRAIILIRRPDETLSSILKIGVRYTPEEAQEHYMKRLRRLDKLSDHLGERAFFVTYRQLIESSDQVLRKLSYFLDLQVPLTRKYEKIWSTGQPGIGDPTDSIQKGEIVSSSQKERGDATIPAAVLRQAEEAYERFIEKHSFGASAFDD